MRTHTSVSHRFCCIRISFFHVRLRTVEYCKLYKTSNLFGLEEMADDLGARVLLRARAVQRAACIVQGLVGAAGSAVMARGGAGGERAGARRRGRSRTARRAAVRGARATRRRATTRATTRTA